MDLRTFAALQIQKGDVSFLARADLPNTVCMLRAPEGWVPTMIMDLSPEIPGVFISNVIVFFNRDTALKFGDNVNSSRLQSGMLPKEFVIEEFPSWQFRTVGEDTSNYVMDNSGRIYRLCE